MDNENTIKIENAELLFLGSLNTKREFGVVVDGPEVRDLIETGWNVREFNNLRYIPVSLPAGTILNNLSSGTTIVIHGFRWNVGTRSGIKAYLEDVIKGDQC